MYSHGISDAVGRHDPEPHGATFRNRRAFNVFDLAEKMPPLAISLGLYARKDDGHIIFIVSISI
jgi:hypothetical protein